MDKNPYDPLKVVISVGPVRQSKPLHPATAVLIGASIATGGVFLLVGGTVFFCWLTEPPSFPGDPNIGLGLLMHAGLLNAPVALGWLIWLGVRIAKLSA